MKGGLFQQNTSHDMLRDYVSRMKKIDWSESCEFILAGGGIAF
jgi:hypothetical protein